MWTTILKFAAYALTLVTGGFLVVLVMMVVFIGLNKRNKRPPVPDLYEVE